VLRHRLSLLTRFHLRAWALCVLGVASVPSRAVGANPVATCQTELQRNSREGGAEEALRSCAPVFQESGCQIAWTELLDAPRAPPGYGRGASIARLAAACEKAYCRFSGVGRQQLCAPKRPPPLSAEFFTAWRSFQTEVLRHEHVPAATSERLAAALKTWTGYFPRPGTRSVLQVVTRPEVPGVVALTLWSPEGERLGGWVSDVLPDEATLRALAALLPPPSGEAAATPCVRLEVTGVLPSDTTEALLRALRTVCPAEWVSVHGA
jgi:hypothetical protein